MLGVPGVANLFGVNDFVTVTRVPGTEWEPDHRGRAPGREGAPLMEAAPLSTRVTDLLGVRYPIVQAPMGWIARAQLASAVSEAGGLGIIETSSGDLPAVRDEIRKMRDLTDKPFGVNIAQLFVRDPSIVEFVVDQGVRFVTTSAGDPDQVHGPAEGRRA